MEKIEDYAYPTMMAEKALKDLHYAMLKKDLDLALEYGLVALGHLGEVLKIVYLEKGRL